MIYQINTDRINQQFQYLDKCVSVLEKANSEEDSLFQKFAVARAVHIAAECIVDVGSVLIDGFIMRDPGGYLDIIDILEDQKVITESLAHEIREVVRLREKLVRFYDEVTDEELARYTEQNQMFHSFKEQVNFFIAAEKK